MNNSQQTMRELQMPAVENNSFSTKNFSKLNISEAELERGGKSLRGKEIGNGKYLLIVVGVFVGFCIKILLAFINHLLPGAYFLYFTFALLSFFYLLTIGKEYQTLYYLSIGLLIAMIL